MPEKLPIIIKGRRRVATNSKFDIYFDDVVDGSGNAVSDYLVVMPKGQSAGRATGVCVLPLVGNKIALVKCYRHAIGAYSWEAPKGFIDGEESPQTACIRELEEETGLVCSPQLLIPLGVVRPDAGIITGRLVLFAAPECRGALRTGESDIGLVEVRLFDQEEMAALVQDKIEDSSTLVAYYRFHNAMPNSRSVIP